MNHKVVVLMLVSLFLGSGVFQVFAPEPAWVSAIMLTSASKGFLSDWEWVVVPNPVEEDYIVSCDFISANDGWALGNKGGIFHWDGQVWVSVPVRIDPKNFSLLKMENIDMVSPDNGWAVGWQGLILHWDGKQWKQFPSPTRADLWDVSLVSSRLGFAGGGIIPRHIPAEGPERKVLLKWDGNQWTEVLLPGRSTAQVDSVLLVSDQEAWATSLSEFYHWNGKNWNNYDSQGEWYQVVHDLLDIDATSPTDVWAVGTNAAGTDDEGAILHWDGSRWSKVLTEPHHLVGIRMFSSEQGWVIGHYFLTDQKKLPPENVVLYWDGFRWSDVRVPTQYDLFSVCGSDPEHMWIFGGKAMGEKGDMQPITLQLVSKPATTATISPTILLTKTIQPKYIYTPTYPFTATAPFAHVPTLNQGEEKKEQSWGNVALIGGMLLLFVFIIFSSLLKAKK